MAIAFRSAATANTGNTTATSITVNAPAGLAAKDVMLAAFTLPVAAPSGGTKATLTPPAGWTEILRTEETTTNIVTLTYVKVAGASEPTSYTWTFDSLRACAAGISAYVDVDNASPVNASVGQANASGSTSVVTPAVTTTVAGALVVRAHGLRVGSATPATLLPPAGNTERWEVANSSNSISRTAETADAVQAAAGSTGTATATASVSVTHASQTIALKPEVELVGMVGI